MANIYLFILIVLLTKINTQSAKIRQLTEENMQKFAQDKSYWLVQISDRKCPNCAAQQKQLQQIADSLEGAIKVAKVDASLIKDIKITPETNPTYIFARSDHPEKSVKYDGKFSKSAVIDFVLQNLSSAVKHLAKKAGDSSNSHSHSHSQSSGKTSDHSSGARSQSSGSSKSVNELSDSNFEQKVLNSKDAWLVEFYSPGCGHCRNLEPQYNKLPKLIGKRVHIAKIDGTKNQKYMGKYQIKGFPTIYLFDTNDKSSPIPYNGERTAEAIVEWLKSQSINQEQQELIELTPTNYKAECNRNIVCLIFILQSKKDKSKLSYLKETLAEQSDKPFRFFYSERILPFEDEIMISDRDSPKMVSIWDSLNSYRIYNGGQNHEEIVQYLKSIMDRKRWIRYSKPISSALFPSNDL